MEAKKIIRIRILALGFILLSSFQAIQAHETDQYTPPLGRTFADLRLWLSSAVFDDLADIVETTNHKIAHQLSIRNGGIELFELQSGAFIADQMRQRLTSRFPTNETIDALLHSPEFQADYPGRLTAYRPEHSLYDHPGLVLDPTKIDRLLLRASTTKINGTLLGTDKLIHFIYMGHIYYLHYMEQLGWERSVEEARMEAVSLSAGNHPILSEGSLLGILTTGVWSNADLAANYAGFMFYLNLTETVDWGGRQSPPLLVRSGHYWRLNDHVDPRGDFLVRFITPHWDEALNPNVYAVYTHEIVAQRIQTRCRDLIDRYRDDRGRVRTPERFAALQEELSTLFGEDYGWRDDGESTLSIANLCRFSEPMRNSQTKLARHDLGRDDLHWAARSGDIAKARSALASGASPDSRDDDGDTVLLAAVRGGDLQMVKLLLEHHANPDTRGLYDTTPLLLSAINQRYDLIQLLLRFGADPNTHDIFGQTALHAVAVRQAPALVKLLLEHGARRDLRDMDGQTPQQVAERADDRETIALLKPPERKHE